MRNIVIFICILSSIFVTDLNAQRSRSSDLYVKLGFKGGIYRPDFSGFYVDLPKQDWDKKFGLTYLIDPYVEVVVKEMIVGRIEFNYTQLSSTSDYQRSTGILTQSINYTLMPVNGFVFYRHNLLDPNNRRSSINNLKPFGGLGIGSCIISSEYKEELIGENLENHTDLGSDMIYYASIGTEYKSGGSNVLFTFEFRYALGSFDQPLDLGEDNEVTQKLKLSGPQLLLGIAIGLNRSRRRASI